MRKKLKLLVCAICVLCASFFVSAGALVSAQETTQLTGLGDQLKAYYQNNTYIEIDTNRFSLSVGGDDTPIVSSSVTLGLDGKMEENLSESVGVYKFKPTTVGTYTLTVSVNYGGSEPYVVTDDIPVLSDSAINAKYELGSRIELTSFGDTKLYSALLSAVTNYASKNGDRFDGSTLYSEMLNYSDLTDIEISGKEISDISGLKLMRLDYIKTISITNCKIASIGAECFENCPSLESVNFANNSITSFALPRIRNLKEVDLSSNQITALDISNCFGDDLSLNLAGNNITKMTDIVLGTGFEGKITLNLIGNNVYEINDQYFDTTKYDMKAGVQGMKNWDGDSYTTSSKGIRYYKSNIEGFAINVYIISVREPQLVRTITDADVEDSKNYVDITLPIGEYEYKYAINGDEIYNSFDASKKYYKTQGFVVKPTEVSYKFEHKGKTYDSIGKVTGTVKVLLSSVDIDNGVDGVIEYSVNGGDWVRGNTIECSKGGTFSIRVRVQVGDYENNKGALSDESTIMVKTSLNSVMPDFVMFFIVLFCALILFVVIVPLVSKKFFR